MNLIYLQIRRQALTFDNEFNKSLIFGVSMKKLFISYYPS